MKIVTRKDVIERVANEWRGNPAIYIQLTKIGKDVTEQQMADIIGRPVISNLCYECGREADAVIVLGEKEDVDSATAHICKECLERAIEMMTKQ